MYFHVLAAVPGFVVRDCIFLAGTLIHNLAIILLTSRMASTTSSATSRDQICCIPHDSARKTSKVFVRSGEYGKHAIASQHMCAGTVVFQCVPLAHSLLVPTGMAYDDSDEDTRRRCARCFLRENDDKLSNDGSMNRLKRCSKCKMVYYCSRSCQVM